jgi:alkylation response protein AidB-like acyl-CoA dehydrogenase
MMTLQADAGFDAEMSSFRGRIRDALNTFDDGAAESWEADGHIPREAVAELARWKIFQERWEPGAEQGLPYLIALSQETARLSAGLALAVMGHNEMFIGALKLLGDGPQHMALLADALAGRAIGCFAATEPQGGSSLAGIRTTASASGAGWQLRGCKRYICNIGEASHLLLLARLENARHANDLTLFVVPVDHPGVRVDGFFTMAGVRACDVGQVTVDAALPLEAMLGPAGLGVAYVSYLLSFERVFICSLLLSGAETALRLAVAYARQRTVGGSRVIDRQAIRHRLATSQAELWNLESRLRELTSRAQAQGRMPTREIAALKLVAGEAAGRIVDTCMQVFGARGCSTNFPIERIWRDCRLARLGGGADEVLADLVASGLDREDPGPAAALSAYLEADYPRI